MANCKKLPDVSCRNCGGTLLDCTQCAECKDVISMICQKCGTRTKEQFHSYCMYNVECISHVNLDENHENNGFHVATFA